jgi:hypothetical protein
MITRTIVGSWLDLVPRDEVEEVEEIPDPWTTVYQAPTVTTRDAAAQAEDDEIPF